MKAFFYVNKWKIPVDINLGLSQDKIGISFQYSGADWFYETKAEIKAMQGAIFDKNSRCWIVDNCKRNLWNIRMIARLYTPAMQRYFEKVDNSFCQSSLADKFWQHQKREYNLAAVRHRCIWAAEQRTGKTLPALSLFLDSPFSHGIFITTTSAKLEIKREVKKWLGTKARLLDYFDTVFPTGKNLSLLKYSDFKKIDVTNEAAIPGFVIFDEMHQLKSDDSERSKIAFELSLAMEEKWGGEEYVLGMTGTPAPKDPTDWWMEAEIVRPGFIRESSKKDFENRLTLWDDNLSLPVWERKLGWNEGEIELLYKRLAKLVVVIRKKDVLDLPPIMWEEVNLLPTKEQLKAAKVLTKTVDNPLALRTKLRQISDGFLYTGSETMFFDSPKKIELENDLKNEEIVLCGRFAVFSAFTGSVDIVTKIGLNLGWTVYQIDGRGQQLISLDEEGAQVTDEETLIVEARDELDNSTNKFKIKKLLFNAQCDTGSTGIELSACSKVIVYSNSDNGASRMQLLERAYSNNMNKARGLTIKDYFCLPTDIKIKITHDNKAILQELSLGELIKAIDSEIT